MSGALLKSVVLALVGVTLQLVLFLIKRGKARRLDLLKKQEEEARKEKLRLMEEEWSRQQLEEEKVPDFIQVIGET